MPAKQPTNPSAAAVLEAHVAFELAQWRGPQASARLREAVDAFWQWAQQTRLDALVDADTVRAAAERLALDMPLPERLAAVIGAIADDVIADEVHRETRVQDVVDQALFEHGVDLFVELEALRGRAIERALDSPVYTALASDVLYQGIKDYIFSDSGAIASIPGVSSLLKGSSNAINKRLPGLEAEVEKRVRAYIQNNTARTLARSQQLLLDSLDEARIRAIADDIWDAIHDQPLAVDHLIDTNELQKLVDYGLRVWRQLRQTEYVGQLVDRGVRAYYARHGDRPIAELLGDVGVDRGLLRAEAATLAPAVIQGLDETGLLEDLVRRRLAPFYASEAFAQALAGSGHGSKA